MSETDWADVRAALAAGARPEELVTQVRHLFEPKEPGRASPPPTPSPAPNVAGLYRAPPAPGAPPLQLCYLRAPLQLLEALDRSNNNTRPLQLDGELEFDVLSLFSPRLIAPYSDTSLTRALPPSDVPMDDIDDIDESIRLVNIGRSLSAGCPRARARAHRFSSLEWAVVYPEYATSCTTSAAETACALLRDLPSTELAAFILANVTPTLSSEDAISVASAAAAASRHRMLPSSAITDAINALKSTPSTALEVLDAVVR